MEPVRDSESPTPTPKPASPPTRKMLVVDDDAVNRRSLRRAFSSDFDVREAGDGEEALEIARSLRPEVIITDQQMPRMTGVELLAKVRDELPKTIRVLITGFHDYASVVGAVNTARIHHYFEKPFHTLDVKSIVDALLRASELQAERERLAVRLSAANAELEKRHDELEVLVRRRTEQLVQANQDLQRANDRLREMALRDELTGLFNRRSLFEQLELELERSKRYERPFSLLFLDVDDFKPINDGLGHSTGDLVLQQMAAILRSTADGVRRSDFVARYGGEEFCALLPETPLAGALVKAERIRVAIEQMPIHPTKAHGPPLRVTVSIGIASYPEHGSTVDDLVNAADAAQYVAKKNGKNRVATAT